MKSVGFRFLLFILLTCIPGAFSSRILASVPFDFVASDKHQNEALVMLSMPEPDLPADLDLKIELAVTLKVQFKKDGKVGKVTVLSSRVPVSMSATTLTNLEQATVEAARKIRFTPAIRNGHRVSQWFKLEYTFRREERRKYSSWRHELIA